MRKQVKRWTGAVTLCLMLTLLSGTRFSSSAAEFKDVPETHWAYEAVKLLSELGIMEGFPDGKFHGNDYMTRDQMSIVVDRLVDYFENKLGKKIEVK